jgi:omega-6 fatty acid desaturase (delta-12 desaturase)
MERHDAHPVDRPVDSRDAASRARSFADLVAPYQRSDDRRSALQLIGAFVGFIALWVAAYRSLAVAYPLTLLFAVPAAGFHVRIFIIQHDCGHGSFFTSSVANRWVGRLCSAFTAIPFRYWQHFHAVHHATSGKMEERGKTDLITLTVDEYRARSTWGRLRYRLYRNPVFLFVLAPTVHFVGLLRLPWIAPAEWTRERRSILLTNVTLLLVVLVMVRWVGLSAFLKTQLPITMIAASVGMWLFYVQHQFDEGYWVPGRDWDFVDAALHGSSFLDLPPLLRWFTGNIGYHHVHHLSPGIPNYRLPDCHNETPEVQDVPRLGFRAGLACMRLKLWDERRQRLVGFRDARLSAPGG